MNYDPLANYWKDFWFKNLEWYRNVLKEHPGNKRAIEEIEASKRILYEKFLIVVEDEPERTPNPIQLELFD